MKEQDSTGAQCGSLSQDFEIAFGAELLEVGTRVIRKQDQHMRNPRRGTVVSIGQQTARVAWDNGNTTVILVEKLRKVD